LNWPSGGVLFLDEVTEMTPAAQAKFLRVLRSVSSCDWEARGRSASTSASSPRPIEIWTMRWRDGEFRADLYYRLNVFDIRIPPLRERRDDIPALADGFLREFAGTTTELTPEAMAALCRHDWPGNVRELRNVIERALIVCDGGFIDTEHLCLRVREEVSPLSSTDLGTLERHAVEQAMRDVGGNKVRAAKQLGISRMQLYGRLRKFGLENV
jgi:DNA-binding NtrC family response regulator